MKTSTISLLLAGGLLTGAGLWPLTAQTDSPTPADDPPAPADPATPKPSSAKPDVAKAKQMMKVMALSPGLAEIIKLRDAGVEDPVILQFVVNAPVSSYPTAEDIITLRENNISPAVVSALLQRGGELRPRSSETAQAAPAPAPTPPPTTAPAPTVVVQTAPASAPVQSPVYYATPATYTVAAAPVAYPTPVYSYGYGCYPRYSPYTVYSGGACYGYGGYSPAFSAGFRFGGGCGTGYYRGGYGYYGGHRGGYYGGYRGCR